VPVTCVDDPARNRGKVPQNLAHDVQREGEH
jgi:hypothetical protein